jgi:DNA-binding CsgD family transcriptional regulator
VTGNEAFWSVFRRSRIPMLVLSGDAVYVDVNDAACNALNLVRDDFVGRRLGFVTDPKRIPDVERLWSEFQRRGRLVVPYELAPAGGQTKTVILVCVADTPEPDCHLALFWTQAATPRKSPWLSPREQQITELLAAGLTGEQIATRLHLSAETVRTHIRNAMTALDARTRAHLIARAFETGLMPRAADSHPAVPAS